MQEEFSKQKDVADDWQLSVPVSNKIGCVNLHIYLANAIPQELLSDVPFIVFKGGLNSGKSLGVEAMIKTLSDQHDAEGLGTAPPEPKMFIEDELMGAMKKPAILDTTSVGKPARFIFSSACGDFERENVDDWMLDLMKKGQEGRGAVFLSHYYKPYDISWMDIDFGEDKFSPAEPRQITVTVNDERLRRNPHFCAYWQALRQYCAAPDIVNRSDNNAALSL